VSLWDRPYLGRPGRELWDAKGHLPADDQAVILDRLGPSSVLVSVLVTLKTVIDAAGNCVMYVPLA
jgi:hypothetical protein